MKKLTFSIVITLFLTFIFTSYSHAANYELAILSILEERYVQLKEENQRQREEILKLYNQLSPKAAEKIPVLLYHHLLKEEEMKAYGWENNDSVISVEAFSEQMKYLYDNGYYTATLDELWDFLNENKTLPEKTVVITFDDGYLSNAVYAYPIMKEYGFKGAIFMRGGATIYPQKPFDPKGLQPISLEENYKYEDVFEYGCHTYDLHQKDIKDVALLVSLSKEEILEDLSKNKKLFNTDYIAYPFGKYNDNTLEYLKELGYKMGFTIKRGYVSKNSDKLQLPRFIIDPTINMDKFKKILQ